MGPKGFMGITLLACKLKFLSEKDFLGRHKKTTACLKQSTLTRDLYPQEQLVTSAFWRNNFMGSFRGTQLK